MEKTRTFKELIVWQKAHQLPLNVYEATKIFPKEEIYGLTSQIRRASVFISANIAESYKKSTIPSKINFLNISESSLEEVKYYLILSRDLGYISGNLFNQLESLSEEIGKIMNGYINAIKNK